MCGILRRSLLRPPPHRRSDEYQRKNKAQHVSGKCPDPKHVKPSVFAFSHDPCEILCKVCEKLLNPTLNIVSLNFLLTASPCVNDLVTCIRRLRGFRLALADKRRQNAAMSTGRLTIDLAAVADNWRALDARSATTVETAATIKADAYGLGLGPVARALATAGARTFFVAVAEEGAALREALGPAPRVFVYGGHMAGDTDMIADLALIPMLNSVEQLTRHFEALPGAPFGIQLDTGMNRLGLEPGEWDAVRDLTMRQGPHLVISHLACADAPDHPMNQAQLLAFRDMTHGLGVPLSLAATGGTLMGPDYHFDLTRPGIGLYGGHPFSDAAAVVRLSLPVIQIRDVVAGEYVGYSCTWQAERDTRLATVSAGYADGILRALSNQTHMFHGNHACPVVGRVSMDLITVDVTDLDSDPGALDLLSTMQTVDDLAGAAGTIGYEILTALGPRYTRRYTGVPA